MKSLYLVAAATVVLATGACNSEQSNQSGGGGSTVTANVQAPADGDWSQVVNKTAEGGFMMGNPNAPVTLIEFGSMTCPHCAEFDETGVQPLIDNYVKSGKVAFEFRNYVRDPFDLTASLIARCNGEKSFFPFTRALYEQQSNWIDRLQEVSPEQLQALTSLGPDQQFLQVAKLAGFQEWAAARGIPAAKSTQCLTNEAEVTQLVQMNSDAVSTYNVPGTPAFVINGKLVEGATWDKLEPQIKDALG